jgi:hypothetical protein
MGQDENDKMAQRHEQLLEADLELWTGGMGMSIDLLGLGASPEQAIQWGRTRGKGGKWVDA